jgi:hypothetical protein
MKKIILLSTVLVLAAVAFNSCTKSTVVVSNENYWLTQERGDVVYSDSYCGYYVVETNFGYTVIRSTASSYRPYEGSVVYGNFGAYGTRDFYNYSSGIVVRGEVVEYDLSYADAQYAIDYYCPNSGKGTEAKKIINSGKAKVARVK